MQVFCWNIYNRNQKQIQDLKQILAQNPQIICLQEVKSETVTWLSQETDYYLSLALDYQNRHGQEYYTVILSQDPIENHGLADNIFHHQKATFSRLTGIKTYRQLQFVDIKHQNQKYRIFNLHLEVLCGPLTRKRQFEAVFDHWSLDAINIICGDLNFFANPFFNWLIGPIFGFHLQEISINERKMFERIFLDKGLENVFFGDTTFPRFNLQLDHILLPKERPGKNKIYKKVHKDLGHSDHYLLEVII